MGEFNRSVRTRGLGTSVEAELIKASTEMQAARKRATAIAEVYGSVNKKKAP